MADVLDAWHRLLQDVAFARNYHQAYSLDAGGFAPRHPFLEFLLPGLVHIKLVALLDEALVDYIMSRQIPKPKSYGESLHGRLTLLNDTSILTRYSDLLSVKDRRNEFAHKKGTSCTWEQFDADLTVVEDVLCHLGYIGDRPKYEFFGEKSRAEDSKEPGIAFAIDYKYGLKLDGDEIVTVSYTKKIHRRTKNIDA